MTTTEKTARKLISGSGWANPLSHAIYLENTAHLRVWADDTQLTLGVDYSVSGVGDASGYEVTITTPASWTPTTWVLEVHPPIDQQSDLSTGGVFGSAYEEGLDAVVRRMWHIEDLLSRAIKTPNDVAVGTAGYETFPPPAVDRVIGWNALGTELENKLLASLPVDAVIRDEDDFVSDDPSNPPSQQSTKAYIGTEIASAIAAAATTYSVFGTLAGLQANTSATITNAYVMGSAAGILNGGGWFTKDTADVSSADNGGTILVDAGGRRWKRSSAVYVTPGHFGAVADGKHFNNGVATSGDATFTCASASWTAADVGKLFKAFGAGAGSADLITTIAAVNSGTSIELTVAPSTTVASSCKFSYGTDDTDAITAARDFCWTVGNLIISGSNRGGLPMAFDRVHYCYTALGNMAKSGWGCVALHPNVWLDCFRSTSGHAVDLNGLSYAAGVGAYRFIWGGAYGINLIGNSNCSSGYYYNNLHWSDIAWGNVRNANIGVLGDHDDGMAGTAGAGAAVGTRFKGPAVGTHDLDSFGVTPAVAWYMTETYACNIEYAQLEVSGSSSPTFGLYMVTSNGNFFKGGTVESCLYGGAFIGSSCSRNIFVGMHNEFNGSGPDWKIDGHHNVFVGCAGVGTAATYGSPANTITGDYNLFLSGEFHDMELTAAAQGNMFINTDLDTGTVSDSGVGTKFWNCPGVVDKSASPTVSAPTLTNCSNEAGWRAAYYSRDIVGRVEFIGGLRLGTVSGSTQLMQFPSGYRPSGNLGFGVYNASTGGNAELHLNSSGQLTVEAGASTGQLLHVNIRFPTN